MPRGAVLLVDDAPVVAALSRIFSGDYDVTAATRADDALALLARGRRFEAIVCDLVMRTIDGRDFHRAVASLFPDQSRRVVFFSAMPIGADVAAYVSRHGLRLVSKPASAAVLRAVVRQVAALVTPPG